MNRTNIRFTCRGFLPTAHCPLPTAFCLLLFAFFVLPSAVRAQVIVDKTVSTVNNGVLATPDLITYSDLVWQLALEPNTPIGKPGSADLNRALRLVTDQRLVLLEAKKLPGSEPTAAEITKRRDELAQSFSSQAVLLQRMTQVGLSSDHLLEILRDRIEIDNYVDFRFRAFVLITDKEITAYYNEVYGSRRNGAQIVPTLDQKRKEIEQKLTEEKIASQIDAFIDNLREHAEIVVLNPV